MGPTFPFKLDAKTGLTAHSTRPKRHLSVIYREPKLVTEAPNQVIEILGGARLNNLKNRCSMIGCKRPVYQSLAIGPATVVELCAEHYAQEKNDLDKQKAA